MVRSRNFDVAHIRHVLDGWPKRNPSCRRYSRVYQDNALDDGTMGRFIFYVLSLQNRVDSRDARGDDDTLGRDDLTLS